MHTVYAAVTQQLVYCVIKIDYILWLLQTIQDRFKCYWHDKCCALGGLKSKPRPS